MYYILWRPSELLCRLPNDSEISNIFVDTFLHTVLSTHDHLFLRVDPSKVPGIPLNVVDSKAKRGKDGVREALKLTQFSTASMGRFDDARKGEPTKKMKGIKRSFRDNVSHKAIANEKVM